MPHGFAIDYIVWVFIVTLGVVQTVCAVSGLRGLLFARNAPLRWTAGVGMSLAVAATVWYFLDERRNLPDTTLGLDANVQARWFAISGAFAIALTFLLASAINHRWGAHHGYDPASGDPPPAGMTWLSQTTFYHAIRARIAYVLIRRRNGAGV